MKSSTLLKGWRHDPRIYFKNSLQVPIISKQQDGLLRAIPRAMAQRKHIYVGSGHSLGKDWTCGGIGCWFLDCFSPSIVIETAPTDRQVRKVMYGETLSHWKKRPAEFGGKAYTSPYIEHRPEDWYLIGFTTKESGASADAGGGKFQGFHAPNVCVIVSEAQAVEDSIFDQIEGVTTNENILVIFIGNPTRATGRFAKGLRDTERNIVFNWSCLDNPNYQQRKTVIPGLANYDWVEDKRRKWGTDDPRWQGRVLGQIPKNSIQSVFPESWVEAGKRVKRTNEPWNRGGALDVAGEGADSNSMCGGTGGLVECFEQKGASNPSREALDIEVEATKGMWNFCVIDCDGMGIKTWQEVSKMSGIDDKLHLIKYHGSARVKNPITKKNIAFHNLRAKAYFAAKDRLESGKAQVPDDDDLIEEMLEVKWFENGQGLIQIEDKDDLKERLEDKRSPDKLDSWVMYQYGLSLGLQPLRPDHGEVRKSYHKPGTTLFEKEEEYPFNPNTV